MALVKEYFELTEKYKSEYGENTILLMLVGVFYDNQVIRSYLFNWNVFFMRFSQTNKQYCMYLGKCSFIKKRKNRRGWNGEH